MKSSDPASPSAVDMPEEFVEYNTGMSLRDYFAAMALQGFLSSHKLFTINKEIVAEPKNYAKLAYLQADAMIEAKKEKL